MSRRRRAEPYVREIFLTLTLMTNRVFIVATNGPCERAVALFERRGMPLTHSSRGALESAMKRSSTPVLLRFVTWQCPDYEYALNPMRTE